ncbi:MAG: hypothetical protein ACR2M5_17395 [Nakamurella sp.]
MKLDLRLSGILWARQIDPHGSARTYDTVGLIKTTTPENGRRDNCLRRRTRWSWLDR